MSERSINNSWVRFNKLQVTRNDLMLNDDSDRRTASLQMTKRFWQARCILNFFLNKGCIFFCQNQTPLIFLSVLINEFKTHKTHSNTDAHLKPTNVNEYAIEKSERWRSQNSLTVIASSRHHSQLNLPEKTDSHKKKTHN